MFMGNSFCCSRSLHLRHPQLIIRYIIPIIIRHSHTSPNIPILYINKQPVNRLLLHDNHLPDILHLLLNNLPMLFRQFCPAQHFFHDVGPAFTVQFQQHLP